MPEETQQAVDWALMQEDALGRPVSETYETEPGIFVGFVRQWFNEHDVTYETFSFDDLVPYLPQSE